jgi:hypothetical protein
MHWGIIWFISEEKSKILHILRPEQYLNCTPYPKPISFGKIGICPIATSHLR